LFLKHTVREAATRVSASSAKCGGKSEEVCLSNIRKARGKVGVEAKTENTRQRHLDGWSEKTRGGSDHVG
jgi:hypothetical protein